LGERSRVFNITIEDYAIHWRVRLPVEFAHYSSAYDVNCNILDSKKFPPEKLVQISVRGHCRSTTILGRWTEATDYIAILSSWNGVLSVNMG
jgi:hypothetical protein